MARLRMDSHAQWEIQEFARAMYDLVKPIFPVACEAFEDYSVNAVKMSSQEALLLKRLMKYPWDDIVADFRSEDAIAKEYGLSKRELDDFKKNWL
jgi:thymidylate synthase ThyX